jgi:phosphate transport system permease protein
MSESSSIQLPQTVLPEHPEPNHPVDEGLKPHSMVRSFLQQKGSGKAVDGAFMGLVIVCALSILFIVLLILYVLVSGSRDSMHAFHWHFFISKQWFPHPPANPDVPILGALPFIYGTVASSLLALCMAVPLALCVSIFLLDICPQPLRGPIAFLTELLAAIPSIVYGLWAFIVLVPLMTTHVAPFLQRIMGWSGLFTIDEQYAGEGIFTAAIILAVMIFPVISSISRDVMKAVPIHQREAVLALGATRWEMIRTGVLRNARIGIVGAVILGLGRALGETMAVTMVIGNYPGINKSLLAPGNTLASVIANNFGEADGLFLSALIEIGLALFLVTIVVNAIARLLVMAVTRGNSQRAV